MGTTKTFLQNASTRHAIFVQRFAGGQIKEIQSLLDRIRKVALGRIRSKQLTDMSRKQQLALVKEIDDLTVALYDKMGKKLLGNMQEFGNYEADFSARMFTKGTNTDFVTPSTAIIEAAIATTPIKMTNETLTIEGALKQFSKQKRKQIATVIKDGVVAGRTNDDISRDLEFVTRKIQQNHANALIRTITNQVSTVARGVTLEENSDIIKGYQWVSTLDGSTTATCQSLDGKVFRGTKGPRPPIHWGCRSTIIPVVKKEFSISNKIKSERPSVGDEGVETVPGQSTYNSWLKKQSKEFQDEVLGETKGALYREGGLSVGSFVDHNFEPLTLQQLRRKEPAAFKKAGLDDE